MSRPLIDDLNSSIQIFSDYDNWTKHKPSFILPRFHWIIIVSSFTAWSQFSVLCCIKSTSSICIVRQIHRKHRLHSNFHHPMAWGDWMEMSRNNNNDTNEACQDRRLLALRVSIVGRGGVSSHVGRCSCYIYMTAFHPWQIVCIGQTY